MVVLVQRGHDRVARATHGVLRLWMGAARRRMLHAILGGMIEREALRIALEVASDAIDQEADWQLRLHWDLTREETRAVGAQLERISRELYERARAQDRAKPA